MFDTSAIDEVFAPFTEPGSAGAAVGLIRNGELEHSAGYGLANLEHQVPFTSRTVVNLGSMAKQFTAFLVALLDDEGALSVDDDIRFYLPELHDFGRTITVHHLIHHLSGLRGTYPELFVMGGWRMSDLMTQEDVLRLMAAQRELNYPPGEEFLYVNSGYALLALILERAAGMPFARLARDRIFAPLAMASTGVKENFEMVLDRAAGGYYETDDGSWKRSVVTDSVVGPTNVWSTVEDLACWERNFVTAQLGGQALVDRLTKPVTLNDGTPVTYGFGLETGTYRGWKLVEHGGQHGGHCGHLARFPEAGFSVAVLFNAFRSDSREYALRVADLALEDRSQPAVDKQGTPERYHQNVGDLDRFSGIYLNHSRAAVRRVTVREGRLTFEGYVLIPLGPSRFCFEVEPSVELRFEGMAGRQTVTTVTGQGNYSYEIVPEPESDPEGMRDYPGWYESRELGVAWEVELNGGRLMVHRQRVPDSFLTPVFADGFTDDWSPVVGFPMSYLIIFERNAAGEVTGFTISGDRVRHLRFEQL
jgi:CubicO group peptidase (beta-lactamase class C family)